MSTPYIDKLETCHQKSQIITKLSLTYRVVIMKDHYIFKIEGSILTTGTLGEGIPLPPPTLKVYVH